MKMRPVQKKSTDTSVNGMVKPGGGGDCFEFEWEKNTVSILVVEVTFRSEQGEVEKFGDTEKNGGALNDRSVLKMKSKTNKGKTSYAGMWAGII